MVDSRGLGGDAALEPRGKGDFVERFWRPFVLGMSFNVQERKLVILVNTINTSNTKNW